MAIFSLLNGYQSGILMKTKIKSRTKAKAMTNAASNRRAAYFNNEPLIQEIEMNAPNTITLDNREGDVEPQEVAESVNLNDEPLTRGTEADAQTITLDNSEGDVEPQEIAEPVISSNEPLLQATEADPQTIVLDEPEGDVEPQQSEVAEFHEQRLRQEQEAADRNKSPIKPQGDDEYAQMLAEQSVFTTKEKIEEAAYFIAERRGFSPGNELSDWCQAETEIESALVNEKLCLVTS